MADPYIDAYETKLYGLFAREQMADVCIGMIKAFDGAVRFSIEQQEKVDAQMAEVLARQSKSSPTADLDKLVAAARDTVIRFGKHLESLKGRPLDPELFFRKEAPSVLARRRLTKLVAALAHIIEELGKHVTKVKSAKEWLADFNEVHEPLAAHEKKLRSAKVGRIELQPEVAAARTKWLEVYSANKFTIGGLLRHASKTALMSSVFDDLAEIHRVSGVSDEGETGAEQEPIGTEPGVIGTEPS